MAKQSKYYLEIQKRLESTNEINILDTIKEIRYTGKPEIIPLLFELLVHTKFSRIRQELITLFCQLKDQNCVPYIIEALSERKYGEDLAPVISSCWQSGLNYSEYMDTFAYLLIDGSYYVALESFTVIEESAHEATRESINHCLKILNENKHRITTEKLPLFKALLDVLHSML